MTEGRPVVYFCYADPSGFSGQRVATELIIKGLTQRGWTCRRLPQPVRERSDGRGFGEVIRYAGALILTWARSLRLLCVRGAMLNINIGQTKVAFLRDGVPLLAGRLGLGRERVIISLHSSLFMRWPEGSPDARVFAWLLRRAGRVTVLGARQRARLQVLGVEGDRVVIIPNTCEFEPLREEEMARKHAPDMSRPIRLLHLSALIDSKGFPDFLEALALLALQDGPRIEAVLCGTLAQSEFAERFVTEAATAAWIEEKIAAINASRRVKVRWIRGAVGEQKALLYREADLFVLPTRYRVEAQPIVLLEAMASGCAIVTTRVGEIETILNENCAWLLDEPNAENLAAAMAVLVADTARRARLGMAAQARFIRDYRSERHLDLWEQILTT